MTTRGSACHSFAGDYRRSFPFDSARRRGEYDHAGSSARDSFAGECVVGGVCLIWFLSIGIIGQIPLL